MTTPTTFSHPELLAAMHSYFSGEKTEALVFILPVGLLSLVFGAWLWVDSAGGFMRGVVIPFLVMGLVMSTVGGVVGLRTPAQVAKLEQSFQLAPEAARAAWDEERARMDRVNAAWTRYLILWGVMGVVGLGLRFLTRGDFTQGLGIALVFFAGVGLLVDGFAERRTHPYGLALSAAQGGELERQDASTPAEGR